MPWSGADTQYIIELFQAQMDGAPMEKALFHIIIENEPRLKQLCSKRSYGESKVYDKIKTLKKQFAKKIL